MSVKKKISLLLCTLMTVSVFAVASGASSRAALPLSSGIGALRAQFESGSDVETAGVKIDCKYYSPAGENDSVKYPVFIWLHGIAEGHSDGQQITDNDIAYFSSAEFQQRFKGTSGAYIFCPRCPSDDGEYWNTTLIEPLKASIDCFIEEHADNIDVSRIYIGGFSSGGKMTWKMLVSYPDFFAAGVPVCATLYPTLSELKAISEVPVWMLHSNLDPGINYLATAYPAWNMLKTTASVPENSRFSTFTLAYMPDGSLAATNHSVWYAATYDMFMTDNENYYCMSTQDASGNNVTLTYPDGLISWMSSFSSEYDAENPANNVKMNFFGYIVKFFKAIANFFKNLFS